MDAFERAGLEVRDTEALREHYALTLRAWVDRLRDSWTTRFASSAVNAPVPGCSISPPARWASRRKTS
jgi:cyclopropane fatty-acyl-phospholipid synthase-like methyltransferase